MIQNKKSKNFNLGIELLRMILSFLIVVYHIHLRDKKTFIINFSLYFLSLYTPTFFLISFYFSFKNLSSRIIILIKERLQRILIPYIIWPFIIFVDNKLYNFINSENCKYTIRDLFVQLIVGRKINDVFWFQFNLIFISIIIIIFEFAFPRQISFLFIKFIVVFAFIFNLKGFDVKIFKFYNICISHSIGRISYSVIYSMTGFFLGSFTILDRINKNHKFKILLFSPVFIFILKEHRKFYNYFPKLNFFITDILIIIIFILFGSIPFDSILFKNFIFQFKRLTSFTGGIYYMHLFLFDICSRFCKIIRNRNLQSCIIIYLLCFIISLIFSNILLKHSKFKYLFI